MTKPTAKAAKHATVCQHVNDLIGHQGCGIIQNGPLLILCPCIARPHFLWCITRKAGNWVRHSTTQRIFAALQQVTSATTLNGPHKCLCNILLQCACPAQAAATSSHHLGVLRDTCSVVLCTRCLVNKAQTQRLGSPVSRDFLLAAPMRKTFCSHFVALFCYKHNH